MFVLVTAKRYVRDPPAMSLVEMLSELSNVVPLVLFGLARLTLIDEIVRPTWPRVSFRVKAVRYVTPVDVLSVVAVTAVTDTATDEGVPLDVGEVGVDPLPPLQAATVEASV